VWDVSRYGAEGKDWSFALGGGATPSRTLRLFLPKSPHTTPAAVTAFHAAAESASQLVVAVGLANGQVPPLTTIDTAVYEHLRGEQVVSR
jgi:hypothetical protein